MNQLLIEQIKEVEQELVIKRNNVKHYYEHGTNPYTMEQMQTELDEMEDFLQDLKECL